jgi:hypothetical protein
MNVLHKDWDAAASELDRIASGFRTDKASGTGRWHGYTRYYEPLFEPLRNRKIALLEIGVSNGASIRTWEKYFTEAAIVGFDIDQTCAKSATARARIVIGNSSKREDLNAVVALGPFDVIIDDGGHRDADVLFALDVLWPHLASGGIYCIEDLGCEAFGAPLEDHRLRSRFMRGILAFRNANGATVTIHPSQNRYDSGEGGQCLVVLQKP